MDRHKWACFKERVGSGRFARGFVVSGRFCVRCGQELLDGDEETFQSINALPCPLFLEKSGDFMVQVCHKSPDFGGVWNNHTSCENIRQAIQMCRNRFDSEDWEIRIWDKNQKSIVIL
jgi:hypothetical protein